MLYTLSYWDIFRQINLIKGQRDNVSEKKINVGRIFINSYDELNGLSLFSPFKISIMISEIYHS